MEVTRITLWPLINGNPPIVINNPNPACVESLINDQLALEKRYFPQNSSPYEALIKRLPESVQNFLNPKH